MYNYMLETLIAVADCGSFARAAEKLFISPTAVMKQMNALEKHLDLTLIERRPNGIKLTPAGEQIYSDAKFIIDYSKKSVAAAKNIPGSASHTFRVGTSILNPAKPFMDLWYRIGSVQTQFSQYKLHLVPFEDNHDGILSEIEKLGTKFDFLIGVCDSRSWLSHCHFLLLGAYRKMIAVPRSHPLADKKLLRLSDLYGETMMMVRRGDSPANDYIRNDLEKYHPKIHIEDTPPFYDLEVFNHAALSGKLLLTIECWQDVHPELISIPADWDYSIPYGLLYSLHPSPDVLDFVAHVQKELHAARSFETAINTDKERMDHTDDDRPFL